MKLKIWFDKEARIYDDNYLKHMPLQFSFFQTHLIISSSKIQEQTNDARGINAHIDLFLHILIKS